MLEADDDALVGLLAGELSPEAALAEGALAIVSGDPVELDRLLELFRFADPWPPEARARCLHLRREDGHL